MMVSTLKLELSGHIGSEQQHTYNHLPFEMPPNVTRIDVYYLYSDKIGSAPDLEGGNTIDIGIFDPRGTDFMGTGFRGWSGSARTGFYIAHDAATDGYLSGPIQAGTWHSLF